MLDALERSKKPLTVKELVAEVGEPDRRLRSRLGRMCEAKRIMKHTRGRADAYTLPEAAMPLLVGDSAHCPA